MPAPKHELKQEAIRLRKEESLSYKEIQEQLDVSKGSLSAWLRDIPLTEKEQVASRRRTRSDKGVRKKQRGALSKFAKMVQGQPLSSDRKMRIAEAAALFRLSLLGFRSFRPTSDNDRVDYVVLSGKRRWTVQVKWCRVARTGLPVVPLRRSVGVARGKARYKPGEFDFIVGYDLHTDICYVFSERETKKHDASITVTDKAAEAWGKLL